jgi:hypothetical protein
MSFELLQVVNGQERERERKEGGEGGFYTPSEQKRVVTALRPGMSGKIPDTPGSLETPGKTRKLRPPKVSTQES